ncbi:hypothetical protein THAOC_02200, partial [Thalassiosira oceanica]
MRTGLCISPDYNLCTLKYLFPPDDHLLRHDGKQPKKSTPASLLSPQVKSIVEPLEGVISVRVAPTTKTAYVEHDVDSISASDIEAALNAESFGATTKVDGADGLGGPTSIPTDVYVTSSFSIGRASRRALSGFQSALAERRKGGEIRDVRVLGGGSSRSTTTLTTSRRRASWGRWGATCPSRSSRTGAPGARGRWDRSAPGREEGTATRGPTIRPLGGSVDRRPVGRPLARLYGVVLPPPRPGQVRRSPLRGRRSAAGGRQGAEDGDAGTARRELPHVPRGRGGRGPGGVHGGRRRDVPVRDQRGPRGQGHGQGEGRAQRHRAAQARDGQHREPGDEGPSRGAGVSRGRGDDRERPPGRQ